MENTKRVKDKNNKFSMDNYSMFYPRGKKDSGFVALFIIAAIVAFIIAIINLVVFAVNNYKKHLTIGLIVMAVFALLLIVGMIIAFAGKPKHINKGETLYTMYKDKKQFKVVEDFSESSIGVSRDKTKVEDIQEYDENGNPIYYAEELFDDEEDIFVNEVNSTLIVKEKAREYKDIIAHLDYTFKLYGISGEIGRPLITTMSFSPLIFAHDLSEHISTFFKALRNPYFVIHYSDVANIAHEQTLFKTFEYAKAHPDMPVFVYIDNIPAREFMNYMRPLYAYIDNPNDDYYISNKGSTSFIPHNVFFMVDIAEGDYVCDIARRYLRYVGVFSSKIAEIEPSEEATPYVLSMKELAIARRNVMEQFALSESAFKKLDNLFVVLKDATGYVLQNKIQRKIEEYTSILLSLGEEELDVIDECFSKLIINAAMITSEPLVLEEKYHVIRNIESEFGADAMKQTKTIIRQYISLYGTKGGVKES